GLELLDAERFALRHAVLLAAGDQYCVHVEPRGVRFCSYSVAWPPSRADRSGIIGLSATCPQQAPRRPAPGTRRWMGRRKNLGCPLSRRPVPPPCPAALSRRPVPPPCPGPPRTPGPAPMPKARCPP